MTGPVAPLVHTEVAEGGLCPEFRISPRTRPESRLPARLAASRKRWQAAQDPAALAAAGELLLMRRDELAVPRIGKVRLPIGASGPIGAAVDELGRFAESLGELSCPYKSDGTRKRLFSASALSWYEMYRRARLARHARRVRVARWTVDGTTLIVSVSGSRASPAGAGPVRRCEPGSPAYPSSETGAWPPSPPRPAQSPAAARVVRRRRPPPSPPTPPR